MLLCSRSNSGHHAFASTTAAFTMAASIGTLFSTLTQARPGVLSPLKRLAERAETNLGFINPSSNGGAWLTSTSDQARSTLGEPLNVVISDKSDPYVLTSEGFLDLMVAVDMQGECLGLHAGGYQAANLGDGLGLRNQTGILRYNYGNLMTGTCEESIDGGNHLRYWVQGDNSSAIFLAVSVELDLTNNHTIVPGSPGGYDMGRDELTSNATMTTGVRSPLTNRTYLTNATLLSGYLAPGSANINHDISIDGNIAVWTVSLSSAIASTTTTTSQNGGSTSSSTTQSTSSGSGGGGASLAGDTLASSTSMSNNVQTSTSLPTSTGGRCIHINKTLFGITMATLIATTIGIFTTA